MAVILRGPQSGDYGWVVYRHGALYGADQGYNFKFEGLVAEVVERYIMDFNPELDRCWIAEEDGQKVGAIFLVHSEPGIAKLRLFFVEPFARGRGVGKMLVDACLEFARKVGYSKVTLWTESDLKAARSLYERVGFKLVSSESHSLFGSPKVGETWELLLN